MSTYTISPCLLSIEQENYINKIILRFLTEDKLKIAIDNHSYALDKYQQVIEGSKHGGILLYWLDQIANTQKYDTIVIDETPKDLFLDICKNTFGAHKILVATKQKFCSYTAQSESSIIYDSTTIYIYDKDEAIHELTPQQMIIQNVTDSNITGTGNISSI